MGRRKQIGPRVDEDVYARFKEYTREQKGGLRGELGRMLENAMIEYMDNDRGARIERKVDTLLDELSGAHTHKATPSEEKVGQIGSILKRQGDTVIPSDDVDDAIGSVAGHDDRTREKYKALLRRKGLAYRHPTGQVWTVDRDQWLTWARDYLDNDPTADIHDMIADYPIGYDEVVDETTEVVA